MVAETTVLYQCDFITTAEILQEFGMDCFGSILYEEQEVPQDPVVQELFHLVYHLYEKVRIMEPDYNVDHVPVLEWILNRKGR